MTRQVQREYSGVTFLA